MRSQGVEVDLAGSLTENTNIIASYGYTDAKVLKHPDYAGKPLPNVPRHTGLVPDVRYSQCVCREHADNWRRWCRKPPLSDSTVRIIICRVIFVADALRRGLKWRKISGDATGEREESVR